MARRAAAGEPGTIPSAVRTLSPWLTVGASRRGPLRSSATLTHDAVPAGRARPRAARGAAIATGPKRASATRVEPGVILVDGRVSEEAWQLALPITDFIQKVPTQGASPSVGALPLAMNRRLDEEARACVLSLIASKEQVCRS
jgi:hypothetical protein